MDRGRWTEEERRSWTDKEHERLEQLWEWHTQMSAVFSILRNAVLILTFVVLVFAVLTAIRGV